MTRPLARPLLALATALASTLGLLLVAPAPATAVTHTGPNWSWDGPADWTAAYGTYGITVLGDRGATLDLGFSSTLCASGATWEKSVKKWFRGIRKQLKQSGWDLTAGKIKKPSGFSSTYRRQVLKGTNDTQGAKRGELTLDYDFTTTVDGVAYCYSRNLAKYADASAWKSHKKTLKQVQNSLAYSGPGAPEGQDPDDF
jgi:hypothetical protein